MHHIDRMLLLAEVTKYGYSTMIVAILRVDQGKKGWSLLAIKFETRTEVWEKSLLVATPDLSYVPVGRVKEKGRCEDNNSTGVEGITKKKCSSSVRRFICYFYSATRAGDGRLETCGD